MCSFEQLFYRKRSLGALGQSRLGFGCSENVWADPDDPND